MQELQGCIKNGAKSLQLLQDQSDQPFNRKIRTGQVPLFRTVGGINLTLPPLIIH